LNLILAAPIWLIVLFGLAMVAAAIEDAARLRISNVTSLLVIVGAVAAAVIEGPSLGLWQNAVVFLAILLLGTAAFSAGWLGGGDVKLFAAAGLWFDLRSAIWFVALTFLAGGAVAIGYMVSRPFRRSAKSSRHTRIPYGIAIALGALAMVLLERGPPAHHERPLPPITINPTHV
jgi:prepilin peptidase CpaA